MALGGGPLGAILGRYPSAAAAAFADDGQDPGGGVIRHDRKCRDWPFLLLFAAFWVAMIVNSSLAFNQGNPLRSSRFHPPTRPPFIHSLLRCSPHSI
jgi:choline transporter-like protein 2/4/5